MKYVLLLTALLVFTAVASYGQVKNTELTFRWDEQNETLIPEDGPPPPETPNDYATELFRIRLQDQRRFPLFEIRFENENQFVKPNNTDFRAAGLLKLPLDNFYYKGIFIAQNPEDGYSQEYHSSYLFGSYQKLLFAVGADFQDQADDDILLWSARAKYKFGILTAMGGASTNPDDIERYTFGGMLDLPDQFILGGLAGFWEDETGYSFNIGRYNKRGDFAGLPSFSLNYLEVPMTYKWTNFRIMWGDAGAHYVRPTFDNGVFSGQLDLDVALMLSQLIPDNYRHFDSPLLFLRYDEYGKVALRVNFIETETAFRKFDANLSFNPGYDKGILKSNRAILSIEHIHNPVFGWQDWRFHANAGTYLYGKLYTGLTLSSDFGDYTNMAVECRFISSI